MSANVNGILNKKISLEFNVSQIKPEIIIVQETKIKRKSQIRAIRRSPQSVATMEEVY